MSDHGVPEVLGAYFEDSNIALALSHAGNDCPLLLVNERFRALTGYDPQDVIGHNCRLLQHGPDGRRADNTEARRRIHRFLGDPATSTVRTPIVNFRKQGQPFVNLLFMSKIGNMRSGPSYIFASQFDVSRTHLKLLDEYDRELDDTLRQLAPVLADSDVILEGTLASLANSAAMIAEAKLTLAELERSADE